MKILTFIFILIFVSCASSEQITHNLERLKTKIDFSNIQSKLSCDPPLVSRWIQEKSDVKKVSVIYGDLHLTRSDLGEPDGELEVKYKNSSCSISLSLMPEIYFSHQDKILLIQGYSGSNSQLEAFDLDNSCQYLGSASLNKAQLEVLAGWRSEIDGSKTCVQKKQASE